ncbi:iron uptake porin [Trichothermofontia sp.]
MSSLLPNLLPKALRLNAASWIAVLAATTVASANEPPVNPIGDAEPPASPTAAIASASTPTPDAEGPLVADPVGDRPPITSHTESSASSESSQPAAAIAPPEAGANARSATISPTVLPATDAAPKIDVATPLDRDTPLASESDRPLSPSAPQLAPVAFPKVLPTRSLRLSSETLLDQVDRYMSGEGVNPLLNQVDQYADGAPRLESSSGNALLDLIEGYVNETATIGIDPQLVKIETYATEGVVEPPFSFQTTSLNFLEANSTVEWAFGEPIAPDSAAALAQVTSVAQLSDVTPTVWAFQALQSLVERYGVIAGYPDGTYRGHRSLSRYEFAAGLNAAMDRINELVAQGSADLVNKEDLETLQRLQEEYQTELAAIAGKVEGLEGRTMALLTDRFSTTAKLFGLAFFNVTGLTGADGVLRETGQRVLPGVKSPPVVQEIERDPNVTSAGLVWLNLGASFTGKDLLITQLATGIGISPANVITSQTSSVNTTGNPFTDAGAFLGPNARVVLREMVYEFPMGNARVAIGPRINWFRFFDENRFTFFLNGTTSLNQIANPLTTDIRRGAGAIVRLPLGNKVRLGLGYLAESNEFVDFNSASVPTEGLFGGTNSLTAELAFNPSNNFGIKFLYNRLNQQARQVSLNGVPIDTNKYISGVPINGIADDGAGGSLRNAQSDIFQVNTEWLVTPRFGLFGRYGIANTNLNAVDDDRDGSITTQSFQVGMAFPDLFKQGAVGTLAFLMPFNYTSGRKYLVSGGGDGGTQYELEGTYYWPVSPNIAIIPNFQVIFNINNFESNPTIFIGNLRTQFSF